jgi:tRNA nucleotidyltransferase (CCA-adding enzyme)
MKVAEPLQVINDRPRPILMGRHLLALGMKPSVEMGRITKGAFEAQLDGVFDNEEGALAWAKARM